MRTLLLIVTLIPVLMQAQTVSSGAAAPDGDGADWPTYGGSLGHQRFSLLREVNTNNVGRLRVKWTFRVPDHLDTPDSALQTTPIVIRGAEAGIAGVDAVMLITSPRARVLALDGASGKLLWEAVPELRAVLKVCCSMSNRGVAYGRVELADGSSEPRVYVATPDARLWAFSAATGAAISTFGDGAGPVGSVTVADNLHGYSLNMAPLFLSRRDLPAGTAQKKDMIVVGISGGEFQTRGFVTAYDAVTGEQLWRFFTIPAPGEFGSETWPSNVGGVFANPYSRGGGGVWMTPAYERESGRIFIAVGNAAPGLDGTHRAGDNLFTDSIVALDVETGGRVWHYQQVHHDLWDYDAGSPPLLIDVRGQRAVAQAGKTGFLYVLDRDTGVPIFPCPETLVPQSDVVAIDGSRELTSPTQPVCSADLQFVPITRPGDPVPTSGANSGIHPIFTPPTIALRAVAPGSSGGSQWSPVSYHPGLGLAFVSAVIAPFVFIPLPGLLPEPGTFTLGGLPIPVVTRAGGTLTAIDVNAGKIRWQTRTAWPLVGGSLVTAGGVLFYGEGYLTAGSFVAVAASTGRELFRYWTKGGVNAAPMSYQANGRQHVAVAAGGALHYLSGRDNLVISFALE